MFGRNATCPRCGLERPETVLEDDAQRICYAFLQGHCKYGGSCKYAHDYPKRVETEAAACRVSPLPVRRRKRKRRQPASESGRELSEVEALEQDCRADGPSASPVHASLREEHEDVRQYFELLEGVFQVLGGSRSERLQLPQVSPLLRFLQFSGEERLSYESLCAVGECNPNDGIDIRGMVRGLGG